MSLLSAAVVQSGPCLMAANSVSTPIQCRLKLGVQVAAQEAVAHRRRVSVPVAVAVSLLHGSCEAAQHRAIRPGHSTFSFAVNLI